MYCTDGRAPPKPFILTGGELREGRMTKRWTQAQAARALGISERMVRGAEAQPDGPLGRSILAGLDRQYSGRNPADPAALPMEDRDRQEFGNPCGTSHDAYSPTQLR